MNLATTSCWENSPLLPFSIYNCFRHAFPGLGLSDNEQLEEVDEDLPQVDHEIIRNLFPPLMTLQKYIDVDRDLITHEEVFQCK